MSKRRSSVIKAAPALGLRLEVDQVLQSLTSDLVSVESFIDAIKAQTSILPNLKLTSIDEIRSRYRGTGKIPRSQCEKILRSVSAESDEPMGSAGQDTSYQLVEKQHMALNIEYNEVVDALYIGIIEADDPRITLDPENKIIVSSDSDITSQVNAFVEKKKIEGEKNIGTLFDYVERARLRACQKELRLLTEAIDDCEGQSKSMASMVLHAEDEMMAVVKEREKRNFVASVTSGAGGATRRGSVVRDVKRAADAASSGAGHSAENTPARLAVKLNELQLRVLKAERTLKYYEDLEMQVEDDPSVEVAPPPEDEDTSRIDWRRRIDTDLARRKAENDRQSEQNRIMHNISLAIQTTNDETGQRLILQRDQIRQERQVKLDRISALKAALLAVDAEINSYENPAGDEEL